MYIPVDPNSVDGMWDKFKHNLVTQKSCLVVSDGKFIGDLIVKTFGEEGANSVLKNMKSRNYVRIGSSHLTPIPAHFTIDIVDGIGLLKEYISLSSNKERLRNDITLICQFSFFENKDMDRLVIPFLINGVEDSDLRIDTDSDSSTTVAYKI